MWSRYGEGRVLFERAMRQLLLRSGKVPCFSRALILLSWYDLLTDAEKPKVFEELTAEAEDCLRQARAENHAGGMACSLTLLGAIAGDRRDLKQAIDCYREGMQHDASLDDFYWVNIRVGLCYQSLGQYTAAIGSFQESLIRGQALGERAKIGWSLANIGDTLSMAGETTEAKEHLQQALGFFEELGTSGGMIWAMYSLSNLAYLDADLQESRRLADKALDLARQTHSSFWLERISALLQQMETSPRKSGALPDPLSERELEVLKLLKSDLDGPEIARQLFVTLNTVRYHTKNIYRKLQVKNRREAVRRAEELEL
jgi:ATP/maltotriose-dependent transcriptional regulator MalT